MNLTQYKALFIVVTAVLALLVASPALQRVLVYPRTEFFTELSLLGPGHVAENYPYNITSGETYSVFLGVGNQLGSCAYYQVEVKFRNETQSAPDSFSRTASSLPSLSPGRHTPVRPAPECPPRETRSALVPDRQCLRRFRD